MAYTLLPKTGDIAVIVGGVVKFVPLEGYVKPAGATEIGVVVSRHGRNVRIVHKTFGSYKWADVFLWKITGYTLDGEDHTMTITANSVTCSITYNATTLDALTSQVDEAVRAQDFNGPTYTCYNRGGELVLVHQNYTSYVAVTATGVTIAARVATEIPADTSTQRWNGYHSSEGAILNVHRARLYFMDDNSSTSYNPSSDVTSQNRAYPICKPGYLGTSAHQSDHCSYLRGIYGDGEEGWLMYMDSCKLVNPSMVGRLGVRCGKKETYLLQGQKYEKADGTLANLYPAVEACASVGFDAPGAGLGDWYLPSMHEVAELVRDITYPAIFEDGEQVSVSREDADPISRGLLAIGGTALGNDSPVWSVSRSYSNRAWYSSGNLGLMYGSGYFYNSCMAAPFVLYKL